MIELTVALAVSTTLIIMVLQLLDMNSSVGRVQIDLATVQQSQRIVHNVLGDAIRETGRGGIPVELALNVMDNVDDDFTVAGNETADATDVLQMRGIFESLFIVDAEAVGSFAYDDVALVGTVVVDSLMPTGIARQPLDLIEEALADNRPVALLVVSAQNSETFSVVELRSNSTVVARDVDGDGDIEAWEKRATLRFSADPAIGVHNREYLDLSSSPGTWPETLTNAALVGILQEYWYYVRDTDAAVDGNQPRLSRAEFYPNTTTVVGDASNGRLDIADNVIDLQIARAFDRDLDFRLDEDFDNKDADEWLGNDPADDFTDVGWNLALLTHVAISTIIQTDRTDPRYMSPPIATYQNRTYSEPTVPTDPQEIVDRRYRRRLQTSVVELRNL